jgi:[acyl-carrier-protein] S-malonyltransferase
MTTTKMAFLFPGQGAQAIGMGRQLAASHDVARHLFEEVNDALSEDLFALMQNGPEDDLRLTRNAQPALFAASMAAVRVLETEIGKPLTAVATYVAGHSLGEYAALAAAGSLGIADAAQLLRQRGDAMQAAVADGDGAMAAILGADEAQIDAILTEASAKGLVQIANDNAPGQIVISGMTDAVDAAIDIAKDAGIRRAIKLPVSAPFHCDLMAPAADTMQSALGSVSMFDSIVPVICNVSAAAETDADMLRANLITQIFSRVRWRETLMLLGQSEITHFIELGTGKVLSGLVKRTLEDVSIANLDGTDDLDKVLSQF